MGPFVVKGRHVVADRLVHKLSTRQLQMIGWSGHGCLHTEPLLIIILQQLEEQSVLVSFLERKSRS